MNIVFYGGHYWDQGAWFRKQQFASRLVKKGHTVIYVESSVSMLKKTSKNKNKFFISKVEKLSDNLYIVTPPALFPKISNSFSRFLSNLRLLFTIWKLLNKLKMKSIIFWFYKPTFASVLRFIKAEKIIFDLCDDIPLYEKLKNNQKGYLQKVRLLKIAYSYADIPIVSAIRIKEKYQKMTRNEIIIAPNGHNLSLRQITLPKKIFLNLPPKPVIGFLGTLFRFIDDDLLEYIIRKRPEYNFVFVGKCENNFPINKISNFANVYLLGEKPKDEIPYYIKQFDICINPFKQHEVNDSVNPVKVFEYLAMKKQVISTPMYSLMQEKISSHIIFSKSEDDFLSKMDNIVKNSDFINPIKDSEILDYHWDTVFNELIEKINKKYRLNL